MAEMVIDLCLNCGYLTGLLTDFVNLFIVNLPNLLTPLFLEFYTLLLSN